MEENKSKKKSSENPEINPTFDQVHEGLNVRTARQALGYTQKELAAKLNEEPKNISNLELQKVISNEALLNKIVDFLRISIEWVKTNRLLSGAFIQNNNDNIINQKEVSNSTQANEINNGVPFEKYDELKDVEKNLSIELALTKRDLADAQKRIAELDKGK